MKYGVETQEIAIPNNSIEQLSSDVLPIIFSEVPAYKYIGKNNTSAVSKSWKECIEQNHYFDKKSFSKLIGSCLQDPEGVLAILIDESIQFYLSRAQYFEMIGCNPELALHLLKTKELRGNLKGWDLAYIGINLPVIAMHILNTPELCEKVNGHILHWCLSRNSCNNEIGSLLSISRAVSDYIQNINKENETTVMDVESSSSLVTTSKKCNASH